VESAPLTHAHSVWEMILHAGPLSKFVLVLLLFFSVVSWAIIIFKLNAYRKVRLETNQFSRIFAKKKSLEAIFTTSKGMKNSPMARVFFAGYAEFAGQFQTSEVEELTGRERYFLDKLDSINRAMDKTVAEEITRLERFLFFLATTGATAPFIGLFGTVWGIMGSFQSIGITGSSNIAVVAPGIAEALIATAAGLVAAVPAVIGYNYFIHRVKVLGTEMDNFILDFLSIIEKNFIRR